MMLNSLYLIDVKTLFLSGWLVFFSLP